MLEVGDSLSHFRGTGPDERGQPMTSMDANKDDATVTIMIDKLAAAAWDQLATHGMRDLHIDQIADQAGIDRRAARAIAGRESNLILHHLTKLDQRAVVESFADILDAGDVTIREQIMEAILHRFEVYAPYRAQIKALDAAARRDPELGIRLLDSLVQAMRRILRMAGDDLAGFRGEARVRGVAVMTMMAARVWHQDESPDLSVTMKEIDRRLSQAEEWGRSLRVFGQTGPAPMGDTHDPSDHDVADAPETKWH